MSPRLLPTMSSRFCRRLQFSLLAAVLSVGPAISADPPPILGAVPPEQLRPAEDRLQVDAPEPSTGLQTEDDGTPVEPDNSRNSTVFAPTFVRIEQDDPDWTYTGSWTSVNLARASGGSYQRSNAAGITAQLTFTGSWISLGMISDRFSGEVEITIDGISQGSFDLYRREETPIRLNFDGLAPGVHSIGLTVTGNSNPLASSSTVRLDYADYGDGSLLPDGSFEDGDDRLLLSNGWTSVAFGGASGGSYIRGTSATAWFPFAGDSFSLHTMAYSSAGRVRLYVDGVYLDTIDLFAWVNSTDAEPRVFSFEGFGSGDHVLQIAAYQDIATIDRLETPGVGPFIDPNPPLTGITRFEADHPSIRYNGLPLTFAPTTWVRVGDLNADRASAGEYVYSATAADSIEFDFDGEWLGLGLATDRFGGQAEIAIDGVTVDTVDLYTRAIDTLSRYYRDLGPGPHTVTITVLGSAHPNASGSRVYLDYFDVWDGQPLADGSFEEDDPRVFLSGGWSRSLAVDASGGAYAVTGISNGTSAWFPFSGDSVTWQGWTRFSYQDVELRINGESVALVDMYAPSEGTRSRSFDGLGSGPHVLELRQYRGDPATLDVITTPATGPSTPPPVPTAIMRMEEDHPSMRYNGESYRRMSQSWSEQGSVQVSRSYNLSSSTPGDVWSFEFVGEWLNLGFRSSLTTGSAEIFIDGVSRGVFDTAGGINNVRNFNFGPLAPGSHTVEVVVVAGAVQPDYADVWTGQAVGAGWYDLKLENDPSGQMHLSRRQWWIYNEDIYAFGGDYLSPFASSNTNAWFNFVGTDLTVLGYERAGTSLQVVIDGVDRGVIDMSPVAPFRPQPRALHFPGLGDGPHSVQVLVGASGTTTARIDAFEVDPADFATYTPEVEWFDTTATEVLPGATGSGFASTIAIGDLDGDGLVELVAPSVNGRIYVYRGDGQDAGNGTPVLWTSDAVGPAAEPALADLDGDGDAEIVVVGKNGTFAFHHDGQLMWSNPAVVSYFAAEDFGWGGPSIGNLDLDPEPEIAIAAADDALYVLDHLGNVLYSDPLTSSRPTVPVLADITGDGVLDIAVADSWTLKVIDFFNGGVLAWSRELPDPIAVLGGAGSFGAPAIADLDGDGRPEIVLNWGHVIEALQDDGSLLWRYETGQTNLFRPSAVTIADVTGDGQVNVVTASAVSAGFIISNHQLMVLDAAGSLVWQQDVADNTASASGVAAQDLTGNGVWEIIWNGNVDGLLLLNGPDGTRLYNEPFTRSGTVVDYPTLADVDGDGQAEIVTAGANGLFVFGHTGRWVDSRPVWNQHHYHINNIGNDWSIPFTEENSWELHNTYRTQTPDRDPACVIENGQFVAPAIVELSPESGAVLPSGVPLVLGGRVLQVGLQQPVLEVEINGVPVDVLDPSGSFFDVIELQPGPNPIEIRAADRCAESVVSIELNGGGDEDDPWADLADASVLFEARFSDTTHDPAAERLLTRVQAFNAGPSVPGPVLMTVGGDADPSIGLLNADGFTPQGEPFVIVVPDGELLGAGGLSAVRDLALANPRRAPIDFTPRWIAPVNQPPYFTSIPELRAVTGQAWRYPVAVADGNGDAVTLSLEAAPAGMSVVGQELVWSPALVGSFDVVVVADDGRGGTARQGFTLQVDDGSFNRPPLFTSTPPVQIPTGAEYVYPAEASDLDGDVLSFSLLAAPAGVGVDPLSGEVRWPQAGPGQHSLVLQADDGRGGRATQSWTLYVGEPAASVPGPAFASIPVGFAAVGVQYRYVFRVNGFGPDAPVVSLVQGPAAMQLDPVGKTLTWVPSGADLGTQVIELRAVDATGLEAIQRFDLQVLPELPNQPPYFVTSPPLNARSGSPYSYAAAAIDPEFQALIWSLASAPAGMTVDPNSGQVDWTPAGASPAAVPVVLQAADPAGAIASQAFTVQLREANVAPVITSNPPGSATVGEFYSHRMLATDADGDPLTWRLLEGPSGMTLHPGIGWLHWTTTGVAPGTYPVVVEVTDDWGGRDQRAFAIELLADDEVPQVAITIARIPACRAEPVNVCVEAQDNVGLSQVTLSIDGQPRTLDSSRCHRWTPPEAGLIPALAVAIDPSGQSGQASETLLVADCNDDQAPVVTLLSPLSGVAFNQPEPIVVTIEDNTPAVLSWEVTLRPVGGEQVLQLASGTGPVTASEVGVFDPTALQAGDYELDVVASDGAQTGGIRLTIAAGTGNKAGRVAFTTADLTWQLGAFPLTIGRSYDSLDAGPLGRNTGDFSPGWRLALSASVEDTAVDLPPETSSFGLLGGEPFTTATRVTVVKPNGERVGFRFDPQGKSFPAVFQFQVNYEPDPGVTDTLRAVGWPDTVFQLGAGFADYLIPYNPRTYELETEDGVVFVVDEFDGLLEIRDPQGGVVTAEPDGWQSSWGARVDYLHDDPGRITDIVLIDEDGSTEIGRIVYGYGANGNLVSVTDLAGGVSSFEYDDPDLPHHLTALFDALGRPIARMVFDDQGRMIAHCPGAADPVTLDGCSVFDFGSDVSTQTVFDGRGFRSELFFDDQGLLILQRDEIETDVWVEQAWSYDAQGREIEYTDGDGGVTTSEWDEDGNLVARTEPDGRRWTWTWGDCSGEDQWLSQCDMLGNCIVQELDAECQVTRSTDPLGGVTAFAYNGVGQRTLRTDPVGQAIATEFDAQGKLVRFTDGLGGEVLNSYGDFGQQLSETERDGIRREWTYDVGVRAETETWVGAGSSGISWSNDAANFVDAQTWPGANIDYSYWPNGKVRRITHSSATAPDWWIEYSYDANNNVTRLEDSFGGITEYDYDGLNRVTEVRQSGPGVLPKRVVIELSNTGQPVQLRRYASLDDSQPGPVTDFEYGCLSCPTTLSRILHMRPDTGVIHDLVYQRNAIHQITGLSDVDGSHAFVHDGRGWLIQADHPPGFPAGDQAFAWDGAGNWLSRSGNFGGATTATLGYQTGQGGHRLLSDGLHSYQYNARGALVERSGPGGRVEIERDARGNAIAITEYDAADQVISAASYVYSSNQQRVRAERDGVVRHYIFDGPNPIIALDDSGQVVWRQLHTRSPDRPLAMEAGGQLTWMLADHIGSVRNQVDNAGLVLAAFSYDAFGRQLSGPSPSLDDPVRYTGREFDLPGGLGYFRLRVYDPSIGRFLREDSIEPRHYRYADNNPLNFVDPSGATSALEYAFLICDDVGTATTGSGERDAVIAAFSGNVKKLLGQLASNLIGAVAPCGYSPDSGD
jgi:RHS repeat-associated protein